MQRPYQAERNPLLRINLYNRDICLSLIEVLLSLFPNLPRIGVVLTQIMLAYFNHV
jgi:hypothetical protein